MPVKLQTSALSKYHMGTSKFLSPFCLTHGSFSWNKRVFRECIMIFKSLSAIGIISFANLRALLNRSDDIDR